MDRMHDWITTGERPLPFFITPFAASASGGGNDDDGDDGGGDDDGDDDGDGDYDPDAGKTEDEIRAELKLVRERLGKANGQSAKRRQALREKERELEEARKPKPKAKGKDDEDDGPDLDALRDEARREGETAGTMRAKKAEAKAELLKAGVNSERVARAVGLLNLGELDLDDDGLDGIEEEIEKLKKDWPELFAKPTRRREGVGGDRSGGGDGGRSKRDEMTTSQRQAAAALGKL